MIFLSDSEVKLLMHVTVCVLFSLFGVTVFIILSGLWYVKDNKIQICKILKVLKIV